MILVTSDTPPKPGYRKFNGLYPFDARNPDEVTFKPGDVIWVSPCIHVRPKSLKLNIYIMVYCYS